MTRERGAALAAGLQDGPCAFLALPLALGVEDSMTLKQRTRGQAAAQLCIPLYPTLFCLPAPRIPA